MFSTEGKEEAFWRDERDVTGWIRTLEILLYGLFNLYHNLIELVDVYYKQADENPDYPLKEKEEELEFIFRTVLFLFEKELSLVKTFKKKGHKIEGEMQAERVKNTLKALFAEERSIYETWRFKSILSKAEKEALEDFLLGFGFYIRKITKKALKNLCRKG
ncbi:hypothetical protein MYX76_12045 [Desulfobacterota bacterium AH_259_B03_O07]|nr:hypothetical protein [Desulfobacterota bacterium AH_259_B03_O07]